MSLSDSEPRLQLRRELPNSRSPVATAESLPDSPPPPAPGWSPLPRRLLRAALFAIPAILLFALVAFLAGEHWLRSATRAALPQIDGSLALPGLAAPVTVQRDAHGVPHIRAASLDDLVLAQAFVTTEDRLFQMDTLRRHAAGELAEILGPSLLPHDRIQRTLQIRAAADRAVANLPPDQLHLLEVYARGVNAGIAAQSPRLPIEFRILRYTPAPWTPRDSLLVSLAMFQDLTNTFSVKLAREALSARLPADLVPDLYPVGSWRDHPPNIPEPDLTVPGPPIEQVPLDESQASLTPPLPSSLPSSAAFATPFLAPDPCRSCTPGSNNWVVSGAHTASGKPLLSNDMHLNLSVPGIWYEADLASPIPDAEPLHVAGVSIPGVPLIVVGHNQHVAWGFTNLGADVQDLYLESTRTSGESTQFQAADGTWQPLVHLPERIVVRGSKDETLDVTATRHGSTLTPVLTPILPHESRTIALRWTLYEPGVMQVPTEAFARAHDWPSFLAAVAEFGGPAQNIVYADDADHIGFHASGRIPLRGPAIPHPLPATIAAPETSSLAPASPLNPSSLSLPADQPPDTPGSGPLSSTPVVPTPSSEWSGYIPFDQLPQVFDPPGGVIATANSRVTPDGYPYPITLDWAGPYRNQRIWRLLANQKGLTPADMLAIQSDIYSDFDHVLAQRLAYSIDHSEIIRNSRPSDRAQVLQAADLLRTFNGQMTADSAAAAVLASSREVLWRLLLEPHLSTPTGLPAAKVAPQELNRMYLWGERDYALEQIIMHTPARWLPPRFKNWDDVLASAVDLGLHEGKAPSDLKKWHYGAIHTVDLEHPIFDQSPLLKRVLAIPTGTGSKPQSGSGETIKQVGRSFGPSERFTADLGNLDQSTLNLVTGQSGNPASPWFLDQFQAWYKVTTFVFPFSDRAATQSATHTLTLTP